MGLLSASQRGELEIFIMLHSYSFHLNRKEQPLTALQLCPMATLWMQRAGADMSVVCVLRGGGECAPSPPSSMQRCDGFSPAPAAAGGALLDLLPPPAWGLQGSLYQNWDFAQCSSSCSSPPTPPAVGWMASADGWGLPEPWHLSPPLAMLSLLISHLLYVVVTKSGHVPR